MTLKFVLSNRESWFGGLLRGVNQRGEAMRCGVYIQAQNLAAAAFLAVEAMLAIDDDAYRVAALAEGGDLTSAQRP
jgi:hypothetical protein